MPFGDGTGPRGMGPMTGRGAGYCAGFNQPSFANPIPGIRWSGFGWRGAYGYSYAYRPPFVRSWPSMPKKEETAVLEEQAKILESELENIRKRLEDLKKQEVKNA